MVLYIGRRGDGVEDLTDLKKQPCRRMRVQQVLQKAGWK